MAHIYQIQTEATFSTLLGFFIKKKKKVKFSKCFSFLCVPVVVHVQSGNPVEHQGQAETVHTRDETKRSTKANRFGPCEHGATATQ